jgi:hypothetical protein
MITNMGWGVFLLYAMLTYAGAVFIYFCLPEMKGRSIESMDDLFQRPLWTMWRHAYPTEDEKVRREVRDLLAEDPKAVAYDEKIRDGEFNHVERA